MTQQTYKPFLNNQNPKKTRRIHFNFNCFPQKPPNKPLTTKCIENFRKKRIKIVKIFQIYVRFLLIAIAFAANCDSKHNEWNAKTSLFVLFQYVNKEKRLNAWLALLIYVRPDWNVQQNSWSNRSDTVAHSLIFTFHSYAACRKQHCAFSLFASKIINFINQ